MGQSSIFDINQQFSWDPLLGWFYIHNGNLKMTYSDLLVWVNNTDNATSTIKVAQGLANRLGTHLTGLYVEPFLNVPVYSGIEAAVSTAAIAELERSIQARHRETRKHFETLTDGHDGGVSWLSITGDSARVISEVAPNHDLVIVGQPGQESEDSHVRSTIDRVAIECGRPMLVVPGNIENADFGKRILVAWNGKRESARAVHDALPFLKKAEVVDVVAVNPDLDDDIPCADIAMHLSRHGVNVDTEKAHSGKNDVSHCLQTLATTYAADMIVMGAYGHSRLREMILGGTTRDMIDTASIPVLMSH